MTLDSGLLFWATLYKMSAHQPHPPLVHRIGHTFSLTRWESVDQWSCVPIGALVEQTAFIASRYAFYQRSQSVDDNAESEQPL